MRSPPCSTSSSASRCRATQKAWKRGSAKLTTARSLTTAKRTKIGIAMSQAAAVAPQTSNALAVEIVGMHKWYGEFHVLRDINLSVERRERIVICGPSGSGKSTMIRCINRLEEHQQGRIVVDGTELTGDLKKI